MRLKQECGVYIIEIITPEKTYRYIGQSVNVSRRITNHKNDLKKNKHGNSWFQRIYNKYNPELKVQAVYCLKEELNKLEQLLIDNLSNVINLCSVKDVSPKAKAKLKELAEAKGTTHHNSDQTKYKFYNLLTKEIFEGTQYELGMKINKGKHEPLDSPKGRTSAHYLISGRNKVAETWCLYDQRDKANLTMCINVIYTFQNIHSGELVKMKRADFCREYNMRSSDITSVIRSMSNTQSGRRRSQCKGWKIIDPIF